MSVMCFFSPFMRRERSVMHDDQKGQLDPSRGSIAADPDGGKLIDGAMWGC